MGNHTPLMPKHVLETYLSSSIFEIIKYPLAMLKTILKILIIFNTNINEKT